MSLCYAETLTDMVAPGGWVVSDYPIEGNGWQALPLPDGIRPNRYFIRQA